MGCIFLLCTLFILQVVPDRFEDDPPKKLSIVQAIERARVKNPNYLSAEASVEAAHADLKGALGMLLPNVRVQSNYTHFINPQVFTIEPRTFINPTKETIRFTLLPNNALDATGVLTQPIFDNLAFSGYKSSKINLELAKLKTIKSFNMLALQVKQSYYQVLLTKFLLEVNIVTLDYANQNLDVVEQKYKNGETSEYDLLRARVQKSNAYPPFLQAKNNLIKAKNTLRELLNIPFEHDFVLTDTLFEKVPQRLDTLVTSQDVYSSTDYMVQELNEVGASQQIKVNEAEYWPVLSFNGTYQRSFLNGLNPATGYLDYNAFVGVRLTYTLFGGGARKAKVEKAKAMFSMARLSKENSFLDLKKKLIDSILEVNRSVSEIEAQEGALNQARRALEIAFERYDLGVGTQLEIISGQESLRAAMANYANAYYEYLINMSQYDYLTKDYEAEY
ncbi:TolC family protein [Aureibacter tunicatorum]|uniref:Outer membrane protein TolC n=1 Tax=Aureibacter tunicatorum TaxID=866807 RepID=A0AAE3XQH9_9BACT|nr:TolC family protein [Aureibacter tunicatorum]MDR6240179.1 outer membrane protein TolC [Aureibacter tunicatorum]BDD05940.1 transporter [Aureibacter tunicatorum]